MMDVMERMAVQEEIEKEASSFWESFVNEVVYHNRFNPNHPIVEFLRDSLQQHISIIRAGTILYRARVINYFSSGAESTGFIKFIHNEDCGSYEGYDEQNSFVPPAKFVNAGRANPERIVYLYAAKEIITAIGETRPRIFDHISVAKIEIQQDLRLADFTIVEEEKEPSLNTAKLMEIEHAFSKPCREAIDYIPTQYIAEYVKTLGYDGIAFRSSYVPGGTNITLFNPEVAKAIASAPYKMDSIIYRARRIFPLKHLESFDIIATNQKSDPKDP